jgi:cysteine synthase A
LALAEAPEVSADYVAAAALPRLVDLGDGVVGAAFEVMKMLPAQHMIDRALAEGSIGPRTLVVETTSGTLGLGLAMVCALRGIPLHVVSDRAIDGFLRQRIADLGAAVSVVDAPAGAGGIQGARLREVERICAETPDHYVPSQYSNVNNPRAYAAVAGLVLEHVGVPCCVVGPVGSGGSMSGTVGALRAVAPGVAAVGVDTHGSVLFGQDDGPRLLRGLGNSLLPPNVDHTIFDEVHWLDAASAFAATRRLHRTRALYMGPSSGAAYLVARHVARRDGGPVVVLLPDGGHRYEDTVYDDAWLAANACTPPGWRAPETPGQVDDPPRTGAGWQSIRWRRRTRELVLAARPAHTGARS